MATHPITTIDISNIPDLARIVEEVKTTKTPRILKRRRETMAVVISPEDYEIVKTFKEQEFTILDTIRARNTDKNEAEVMEDATRTVDLIRQQQYEAK